MVPENYIGSKDLTTATCASNGHCVFTTESDEGMSIGAVIGIIIACVFGVAALVIVVKLMFRKKPEDAMVSHVAYSNLDGGNE